MFQPGLRQVIVGDAVARRYPGAQIGKDIRFGKGMWSVVGVFKAGDSAANSEIWGDLDQIRGDFEREGGSSSLLVRLNDAGQIPSFIKTIGDDQRLSSGAIGEKEYYANLTSSGAPLEALGFAVAIIMAIGSAFAATNTMYAAVARRSREIGTLRAIGFGRWAILRSFMLESIFLALIGGAVGVLIALPINGLTTGVGSFATFSEVAFRFKVGAKPILLGLVFATIIGALGGFLPAWAASKKGIIAAMRDV
jgi:ABC-type antimicrobial peptide transport system permease subunit